MAAQENSPRKPRGTARRYRHESMEPVHFSARFPEKVVAALQAMIEYEGNLHSLTSMCGQCVMAVWRGHAANARRKTPRAQG